MTRHNDTPLTPVTKAAIAAALNVAALVYKESADKIRAEGNPAEQERLVAQFDRQRAEALAALEAVEDADVLVARLHG